jgi:hypothetical protein
MGLIYAFDDQDDHPTKNAADAETQKCPGLFEKLSSAI